MSEAKQITSGFNLYQPWATAVVEGRIPVLVRPINTKKRYRVAVIANEGIDGIFLNNLNVHQLQNVEKFFNFGCILGSIEIVDSISCKFQNVTSHLEHIIGKSHFTFYPIYLLPTKSANDLVYLWILNAPIKLTNPIPYKVNGQGWNKVKLTHAQNNLMNIKSNSKLKSFWNE